jgi:hypothetical protein
MRVIPVAILMFLGAPAAWAANAPSQLYGKTVTVSWSADVVRREVGAPNFAHSTHRRNLIIYISTTGRPFLRQWVVTRSDPKVNEQAGTSGDRAVEFRARSLLITTAHTRGASRVQIDFDANFGSCTADVVVGKEEGADSYVKGDRTGHAVEVQSVSISGATCSIEEGNFFAK